jgi:hypothetical protein
MLSWEGQRNRMDGEEVAVDMENGLYIMALRALGFKIHHEHFGKALQQYSRHYITI